MKFNISSELADRYALSDRAFAALASGVLSDAGIVNTQNTDFVVDTNKARRARLLKRKSEESKLIFDGTALFFDGRKDNTLKLVEVEGIYLF